MLLNVVVALPKVPSPNVDHVPPATTVTDPLILAEAAVTHMF